jgi:hypothetical protein
MKRILCLLACIPALAAGQDTRGPCPGSVGLDSVLQGYVTKPDHKPRRQDDGVEPTVDDGSFVLVTGRNDNGAAMANANGTKVVRLVAVVDTTGRLDTTSVAITDSPNAVLTQAVCTAALQMRFDPATLRGRKVAALYKDWFTFRERYDLAPTPQH